jgi:hypothetical protein
VEGEDNELDEPTPEVEQVEENGGMSPSTSKRTNLSSARSRKLCGRHLTFVPLQNDPRTERPTGISVEAPSQRRAEHRTRRGRAQSRGRVNPLPVLPAQLHTIRDGNWPPSRTTLMAPSVAGRRAPAGSLSNGDPRAARSPAGRRRSSRCAEPRRPRGAAAATGRRRCAGR